jgi:hypothetical protein
MRSLSAADEYNRPNHGVVQVRHGDEPDVLAVPAAATASCSTRASPGDFCESRGLPPVGRFGAKLIADGSPVEECRWQAYWSGRRMSKVACGVR